MGEGPIRQRAHHPEHDFIGGKGVGRQVQHQRGERRGQRRQGDTCEDQHQRAALRPGQKQDQPDADARPGQGRYRQGQYEERGKAGLDGQNRAQGCGRGHADQPRFGQRIAQIALHGRPRKPEADAHHHRQNGAGQADFAQHHGQRAIPPRQQRPKAFARPRLGRAGDQRQQEQRGHQQGQRQHQQRKPHLAASSAARAWASPSMADRTEGRPQTQSRSSTAA